jgi:uncharacterized protein YjdB
MSTHCFIPRARAGAAALLSAVLAACGGGDTAAPCTVSAIAVSPTTASVVVGATSQLTATITSANCTPAPVAAWSTGDAGIATVSTTGLVTAVAPGTVTISASNGGRQTGAVITVTPVPVATVAVTASSTTINVGASVPATATLRDASNNTLTGRTVTWSSSATGVATVNGTGVISGVSAGTATITATSEGRSGTLNVTIQVPVATVDVSLSATSLYSAQTATATATPRATGGAALTGRTVTWSSSASTVATVNATTGAVTAVAPGLTEIRATSEGVVGVANLFVSPPENQRFAFVWNSSASEPLNTDYTPNALYSFNQAGGTVSITRTATGRYRVTFGLLAKGLLAANRETMLVSAYNSAAVHCSTTSWGTASARDMAVNVSCATLEGTAIDSRFTLVMIGSNTLSDKHAFFWSSSSAGGTLSSLYSFSSGGGANANVRSGPGDYAASFPGMAMSPSHVAVTTYGSAADPACQTTNWDDTVFGAIVRCTDALGALTDGLFNALVLNAGRSGKRWAYAWSSNASGTIDVAAAPSAFYRLQSNNQVTTITRTGTGLYTVRFPGMAGNTPETIIVAPYTAGAHCQIQSWSEEAVDLTVSVRCFSRTAPALQDARFTILLLE